MSRQDDIARILDLQVKADLDGLTPAEEKEFKQLEAAIDKSAKGRATENQKDFINELLDEVGADLESYIDKDIDELTFDEASELIETLKDEK